MTKVQICFAGKANLENVKKQLVELVKDHEDYEFYTCFLSRKHVEEKGFSTDIVDMLDEVLGNRHVCMTSKYDTFADVMSNIEMIRQETADLVNRMYVLDSGTAEGVAREIALFTRAKVILMP